MHKVLHRDNSETKHAPIDSQENVFASKSGDGDLVNICHAESGVYDLEEAVA